MFIKNLFINGIAETLNRNILKSTPTYNTISLPPKTSWLLFITQNENPQKKKIYILQIYDDCVAKTNKTTSIDENENHAGDI